MRGKDEIPHDMHASLRSRLTTITCHSFRSFRLDRSRDAQAPPLGRQLWHGRRQVSWLAGRRLTPDLPGCPVVDAGIRLAVHSCGGSHGFDTKPVPSVFPLSPQGRSPRGTSSLVILRHGEGAVKGCGAGSPGHARRCCPRATVPKLQSRHRSAPRPLHSTPAGPGPPCNAGINYGSCNQVCPDLSPTGRPSPGCPSSRSPRI